MRILVASDTYPPQLNGAAVAAQRLVRGLAGRGHRVEVVAPNMAFRDEVRSEPETPGVTVRRVKSFPARPVHPQFRVTAWVGINAKLRRIFADFQPDVVHLQTHFVLGKASLRRARKQDIPVVGTNHFLPENLVEYFPRALFPVVTSAMWVHWMRVYNRLDCVVAPSRSCLEVLEHVGMTAPARVISNGIDLERFSPAYPPGWLYGKYGIRPDVPVLLTVGRLEKDKRVDMVIRAAALAARSEEFQLVVVGKGRDEAEFRELGKKVAPPGSLVFTGFVPDEDLPLLYNVAHVYIGAGAAELQGIAVMEAMASGLPVLAADSVALPELMEHGGNGFLFQPTDEDLSARILEILSLRARWEEMGDRSLALVQPHRMTTVLEQVEGLYRELMASRNDRLARQA